MTPPPFHSVIIPNWCGGEMLRRGLLAIFKEARAELRRDPARTFEVIVCDDASPGDEVAQLRSAFSTEDYPELRIIERPENSGFGPTVNEAADAARGAIFCLCNNDLAPQRGYFRYLIDPLRDGWEDYDPFAGTAATSARTEDGSGAPNHACMRGAWLDGRMRLYWRDRPMPGCGPNDPVEAHFLQGGAAAIRSEAWRALAGLDDTFAPGYWEDYDFSHRLRARGGRIFHTPGARAFHLGMASMKAKHGAGRVRDLQERNRLIFEALHAPEDQRGKIQRRGAARDVAREWRAGGPYHLTRGLRLLSADRNALGSSEQQQRHHEAIEASKQKTGADPEANLYPLGMLEAFLPSNPDEVESLA